MKKYILTVALMTVSLPAFAQNDLALCRLREQHVATKGVAYQPGVDVHGKAVVPADVNAAPSVVPDVVRIPLTVDLAQRLSNVPAGVELKADTGMVEVHKDGRVVFNGQDLTGQAAVVCGDKAPVQESAPTEEAAAPVPPTVPAAPATAQPTKIVVPVDAPAVPMATVPVVPQPAAPVVSRVTTDHPSPVPANAVASPPLPPQTLGQFTIPAAKTDKVLAAPAMAPKPSVADSQQEPASAVESQPAAETPAVTDTQSMGERTNEDLEKDNEIIWGEGN